MGTATRLTGEDENAATKSGEDCEQHKKELEAARERFAKLLEVMSRELDADTRGKLLRELGRKCAQDYLPFFKKYSGDLRGFLDKIKSAWVERVELDEKAGLLRVIGKPAPCACPLVKKGRTPEEFCNCSLGWNQAAFSTVLGKPVAIELEESVLRGGSRCSFRIRI